MNKEKAIEQMGEALNAGYEMNSGKISAQMNAQVTLGEDSIPMELAINGAVKRPDADHGNEDKRHNYGNAD